MISIGAPFLILPHSLSGDMSPETFSAWRDSLYRSRI